MSSKMKPRTLAGLVFAVVGFAVLFQNCGGGFHSLDASALSLESAIRNTGSNSSTIGATVDPVSGLEVYNVPALCAPIRAVPTIDLLRPVLATRNTACIMCHAQINGDLVTDFGYGDPFFFGLDDKRNHPLKPDYGPFVSKHFIYGGNTWAGSSIMGNVYVPDATMTDSRILASWVGGGNAASAGVKLVDYLKGPILNTLTSSSPITILNKMDATDPSFADINAAGLRGNYISRKDIWIDAPGADEIRTLLNSPTIVSVIAKLGLSIAKSTSSDVLVGLVAVESTKTHKLIAQNADVLTCRGDIIIDGVLFLNNAKLATDDKGCRLYVTGSVFIQGPITYVNGGNSNIQITSASAVIMGMRSLMLRLSQDNVDQIVDNVSGVRLGWTDSAELALNAKIFADRDSVDGLVDDAGPTKILTDAGGNVLAYESDYDNQVFNLPSGAVVTSPPNTSCSGCTFTWAGGYMRKSVDYTHMVLNAPKVMSRYYGTFQGVIISEDVLFAIGNFKFNSDPVMSNIPLLPLVGDRVFSMSTN